MKIVKASVMQQEDGLFKAEVTLQSNGVSHTETCQAGEAVVAVRIAVQNASYLFVKPLLDSIKITTSVEF